MRKNKNICPECGRPIERHGIIFDAISGTVTHNGITIVLTNCQSLVFEALFDRFPSVVRRNVIWDHVYFMEHEDRWAEEKIVDVFVCQIRKKTRPIGIDIVSRWGVGYSLEVSTEQQKAA